MFPGGAADPGDDGLVATALREAGEEIGLDPSMVHVLGTLPALALPDTGFLLTPVLAWTSRAMFSHSPNLGEVSALVTRTLQPRSTSDSAAQPTPQADAVGIHPKPDAPVIGSVTNTIIDVINGMLARALSSPTSTCDVELT